MRNQKRLLFSEHDHHHRSRDYDFGNHKLDERIFFSSAQTMKERITYIPGTDDAFEPSQLQVEKTSLIVKNFRAAREDRLTFDLDELPQEVDDQLLGRYVC